MSVFSLVPKSRFLVWCQKVGFYSGAKMSGAKKSGAILSGAKMSVCHGGTDLFTDRISQAHVHTIRSNIHYYCITTTTYFLY